MLAAFIIITIILILCAISLTYLEIKNYKVNSTIKETRYNDSIQNLSNVIQNLTEEKYEMEWKEYFATKL